MIDRSLFLLLAALLAGCPPANDDDSAGDDDDDSVGDDDDSVGDDDDATGDDDDSVGDDDDATGDDDDSVGDDDDSVGDDDDSAGGGACSQPADHSVSLTIDPTAWISAADNIDRFFYEPATNAQPGTAVSSGDTVSFALVFDPPLSPARDAELIAVTAGWSGAPVNAEGGSVTSSTVMEPATQPSGATPQLWVRQYTTTGGQALGLELMLEPFAAGDSIECVGGLVTVPANVANVGLDASYALANCAGSFCEPALFEPAAPTSDPCDIWADNVHEVSVGGGGFALTNDGTTNGVLRYDADFPDLGVALPPDPTESYAFVMNFADPLEFTGDWDEIEMYFDNTYPTTNNVNYAGPIPYGVVGSSDVEVANPWSNTETNGSALEWRPGGELVPLGGPAPGAPDAIAGAVECVAFAFWGGDHMTQGNVLLPPSTVPVSRFTIRGDCLGSGATCATNELGFPSFGGGAGGN